MNRPLSFLHVTTFYPPYSFGGDAAYVQRLAGALADEGHHVDVLHSIDAYHLFRSGEPAVAAGSHPGVTTHGLRSGSKWLTMLAAHQSGRPLLQERRIQAVLDSRPYDVIHFHNISLFGPGLLAMAPAGRTPLKVYTTHEHWLVCPTHVLWKFNSRPCERPECLTCTLAAKRPPQWWRYTNAIDRAAAHVDAFISPSRFTARMHADRGFHRAFDVLPLFVSPAEAALDGSSPHPRPYVLFVGRLERLKGVDGLIEGAVRAGVDLVIAGSGTDEARLRSLAASRPSVRFLGAMEPASLGTLYRHALACCVPSLTYEVFPTVALESFAYRTPVIAHDIGGLTEIVEDSGGGLLYRSPDDLVAAIRTVATDEASRRAMGERGYGAVAERWSRQAHLARYFAILEAAETRRKTSAS